MKKLFGLLLLLVTYTSYGQTGVLTNKYYISGSLSVGSGARKFADSSAYLEVGTDSSRKGLLIPRGNVNNITTAKPGTYYHNYADSALYSIIGNDKIRQLNDRDTINKLATKGEINTRIPYSDTIGIIATKQDFTPIISLVKLATDSNRRYDCASIIKDDNEYIIAFNQFRNIITDISGSEIVAQRTQNFIDYYNFDTIVSPVHNIAVLNPSFIKKPNGDILCYFTDFLNSSEDPDVGDADIYKTKKIHGTNTWSIPEVMIDSPLLRLGTCPNRAFDMGGGRIIYPYYAIAGGGGTSSNSWANGYIAKSTDYGETLVNTGIIINNGSTAGIGSVYETGIYADPRMGNTVYFRTLNGEIRKVVFNVNDTGFTSPSALGTIMPAQNAMSSFYYDTTSRLRIGAVMRFLRQPSTKQRQYIDLVVSDNGYEWEIADVVDYADGSNELNEPVLYFTDSFFVVVHSKTRTVSGKLYYDLFCKKYPRHFLQVHYGKPITQEMANIAIGGGNGSPLNDFGFQMWRTSVVTDSSVFRITERSSSSANAKNESSYGIRTYGPGNTTFTENFTNIRGDGADKIGKADSTNIGDTGIAWTFKVKDITALELHSTGLKIPTSPNLNNFPVPEFGTIRVNPSTTTLQYTMNGRWKNATENYFYDLRLAQFANDSTYTDTSMKLKKISVFDNVNSRYLDDTSFTMLSAGGFKFTTRKVSADDRFIVRVESIWTDGLIKRYLPLDTMGKPLIAVSFRKLRSDYTGYSCRLTSLADVGSFIDVGFTPYGELDTFKINNWIWKDSCYISRWYNQGSFSTIFLQSITVPQGVRFRKIGTDIYADFNGSSYMNTNNNTSALLSFLHSGDSASTANVVFVPSQVTTSSVYGIYGNNAGTTAARGISLSYDNRSAQNANSAIIAMAVNGNNGQYVVLNKYNSSGVIPDTKNTVFSFLNFSQSTTAKSRLYVNASLAQMNNVNADLPSAGSAITSFSLGSVGSNNVRMKGNIYEFILYGHEITEAQRISLRNNQNARYQIY